VLTLTRPLLHLRLLATRSYICDCQQPAATPAADQQTAATPAADQQLAATPAAE